MYTFGGAPNSNLRPELRCRDRRGEDSVRNTTDVVVMHKDSVCTECSVAFYCFCDKGSYGMVMTGGCLVYLEMMMEMCPGPKV